MLEMVKACIAEQNKPVASNGDSN